jgi:hypothetical protein
MDILIIVLFFLGIIMAVIGYYQSFQQCPKQKIEYRFMDKTIEEAQKGDKIDVWNEFKDMFTSPPILQ